MRDFYTLLGVSKDASDKEVRQAYRKQARQYHPDLNPGDLKAEGEFKKINEAYEVLSDPEKRKNYDKYGDDWKHADQLDQAYADQQGARTRWHSYGDGDAIFGVSGVTDRDFFADIFAGMEDIRPSTARYPVQLTLEEASSGVIRYIEVTSGGPGGEPRKLEVKIPPGVDTGSRVRIPPGNGRNRQIYLEITVRSHSRFRRSGSDLHEDVEIPLADAVLGSEVAVPTLMGRVMLTIPPETQNGQVFRLSGQGMPHLDAPATKGDLLAMVKVVLPKDLTEEERQLFEKLKELRSIRRL